jgi:hypothetical protein
MGTGTPWPPSIALVIRASAARMNGTARVSRAKISPRRERSRNATTPIPSASTAHRSAAIATVR